MKNSVVIKGNKYGIVVVLDAETPFEQLEKDLAVKFKESSKFFESASMAISFEGRELSSDEQNQILDIITDNSDINVVCIMDNNKEWEELCKKTVQEQLENLSSNNGQFYKGTLRSGQILESERSIVVLGDVNPGAKVISAGNVIVLGSLKGTVYAGITGNQSSFVVALEMHPMQIRIGEIIARSSDKAQKKSKKSETKIAFVEDNNIYIETLTKDVLNDINLY